MIDIELWHWDYYFSRQFPFIRRRKAYTTYRGDCTVWHNLKTGKRADSFKESQLYDIWWMRKYGNQEK